MYHDFRFFPKSCKMWILIFILLNPFFLCIFLVLLHQLILPSLMFFLSAEWAANSTLHALFSMIDWLISNTSVVYFHRIWISPHNFLSMFWNLSSKPLFQPLCYLSYLGSEFISLLQCTVDLTSVCCHSSLVKAGF